MKVGTAALSWIKGEQNLEKLRKITKTEAFFAYALLLPATLALVLIRVVPLLEGIGISFTNRRLLQDRPTSFVGIDNFIRIFTEDKEFWRVLGFTFFYTIMVVLLSYCMGLIIALLMNIEIKGRGIFRTLLLMPWIIPGVVAAASWKWALNDQSGVINMLLQSLHITSKSIPFLASTKWAKVVVILVGAWKNYPYMALSLLAGLQNVPTDTKEAAKIDGANVFQSFFRVVLPQIRPVTMVCTTLMFIWTFNNFDNIFLLTGGGPDGSTQVMSVLSYYSAFSKMNMGYASALSTVMLAIMMVLAVLYIRMVMKKED